MIEWLLTPIDASRIHALSEAVKWHGRSMTLAWGILVPLGVLAARYFKILPWQDWPRERDSHAWWITHRLLHYLAGVLTLVGIFLVFRGEAKIGSAGSHAIFAWTLVLLALGQFLGGWFRGSKGGPTERRPDGSLRGDHYDMTPWRIAFEYLHKIGGYAVLAIALGTILSGLWRANATNWMWLVLALWWLVLLIVTVILQRAGRAFDTYQAIWGPDKEHPGNARRPIGIGIARHKD